jgi:hypothetical protein
MIIRPIGGGLAQVTSLNALPVNAWVRFDGWIAIVPTPRLIGGDFNILPSNATYGHTASGFNDVWTGDGADRRTWHHAESVVVASRPVSIIGGTS